MTISHEGVLKLSRRFDVLQGDLRVVLGCLEYVLEKTANVNPNLTQERNGGRQSGVDETADVDADDPILLDDNDFLHPPTDEEDEDGEGSAKWYTKMVSSGDYITLVR